MLAEQERYNLNVKIQSLATDCTYLKQKLAVLEAELKWKSQLLQQRTEVLYALIQQSQGALNKLPVGMVE